MPTSNEAIKVSNVAVNSPCELSLLHVVSMKAAIRVATQKAYLSSISNTEKLNSKIDILTHYLLCYQKSN